MQHEDTPCYMTNISISAIRRAAANADLDVRTVAKAARGEPVRGLAGERAVAALRELGIEVRAASARGARHEGPRRAGARP